MTNLEKKWWFVGGVAFVTAILTIPLLTSAGILPITGVAQGLVGLLCFLCINRLVSAFGRFIAIMAIPSSRLLD